MIEGPWYHVSDTDLPPGTKLVPGGTEGLGDMGGVFLTDSPENAYHWADIQGVVEPHIYEVDPSHDPEDVSDDVGYGNQWVSPHATIKNKVSLPKHEELWEIAPREAFRLADAEEAKALGGCLMICPRMDDAVKLAIPDGEPLEDLHTTLLYFGEKVQGPPPTEILSAMDQIAGSYPSLHVNVFSHAVFNPHGDDPCYVYLIGDSPELADLRRDFTQFIDPSLYPQQHEPWIPHITGIYQSHYLESDYWATGDLSLPNPLSFTGEIVLDHLLLSWGGEDIVIPLSEG